MHAPSALSEADSLALAMALFDVGVPAAGEAPRTRRAAAGTEASHESKDEGTLTWPPAHAYGPPAPLVVDLPTSGSDWHCNWPSSLNMALSGGYSMSYGYPPQGPVYVAVPLRPHGGCPSPPARSQARARAAASPSPVYMCTAEAGPPTEAVPSPRADPSPRAGVSPVPSFRCRSASLPSNVPGPPAAHPPIKCAAEAEFGDEAELETLPGLPLPLPSWLQRPGEGRAPLDLPLPPVGLRRASAGSLSYSPLDARFGFGVEELKAECTLMAPADRDSQLEGIDIRRDQPSTPREEEGWRGGESPNQKGNSSPGPARNSPARPSEGPYTPHGRRQSSASTPILPPCAVRVTKEDLVALFDVPVQEVSRRLGLGVTVLKKICRSHGISRWPQRKLTSIARWAEIGQTVLENSVPGFDRAAIANAIGLLREARKAVCADPSAPIKGVTSVMRKLLVAPIYAQMQLQALEGPPASSAQQLSLEDISAFLQGYNRGGLN